MVAMRGKILMHHFDLSWVDLNGFSPDRFATFGP
jgi:hypothetical protein